MLSDTRETLSMLQQGQAALKDNLPLIMENFKGFAESVTQDGLLSKKEKELIAVAVAVGIRCQPCIANHVKRALECGASVQEILESCSVAVMMGGGPAVAYTSYVVKALKELGAEV